MTVNVVKKSDTLEEGIDTLMGAMVDEYNAISRLGVKDDVLLCFAPCLKLGAVYGV